MKRRTGVRLWKGSWQASVKVHGKTYAKSFPLNTPSEVLQQWRETQRRLHAVHGPAVGSFAEDIQTYLSRVSAMPTYKQRQGHLELWAKALGRDRSRYTITATEIEQVMQNWLNADVAPATVRKRRTALLAFWNRLDGCQATNPVRASHPPSEPKPEARGFTYATIQRILAAMPPSRTKRRLTVLAWTGLPPSILSRVRPGDVDFKTKTIKVQPRRKGAGAPARVLPLLPQAVKALKAFDTYQDYGPFAKHWTRFAATSLKRGAKRANVTGVRLYDLRHSFAGHLYATTKDLATVARFLLHASLSTTQRYAESAVQQVDQAAAKRAGLMAKVPASAVLKAVPKNKTRRVS